MSGILKLCFQVFGGCCRGKGTKTKRDRVPERTKSVPGQVEVKDRIMSGGLGGEPKPVEKSSPVDICVVHEYSSVKVHGPRSEVTTGPTVPRSLSFPILRSLVTDPKSGSLSNRLVQEKPVVSVHLQLVDGMSTLVASALESLNSLVCAPWSVPTQKVT